MKRKIKYGKIAIVIFLTVLIWVWADLAQERQFPIASVTIRMAESIDPTLLANFKDEQGSPVSFVSVYNVALRGPATKVDDAERRRNKGTLQREFFLDPEAEGMIEPGERPLDVLNFLKQSKQIRDLGLTVESCEPQTLTVHVTKLEQKSLTVRCFDEDGLPIQEASIDRPEVLAFVPPGQTVTARVRLAPSEVERARTSVIEKTPYIELPGGQTRELSRKVKITMPPAEDVLSEQTINRAKLGITLSVNLQGMWQVQVTNLPDVIRTFKIRATREAKEAYSQQPFQMTLQILDGDEQVEGEQTRDVVYNLPWQFVRNGEIVPPQPPAEARFKVVSVTDGAP